MAKAKGTILVSIVKYLRGHKEEARRLLPPALHHYLDEKIVMSAWYPEADLIALLRAGLTLAGGASDAVLDAMGRATAHEHHEGIYAHLLARTGTQTTTSALWSSQHDTGVMALHYETDHQARLELTGYAHPSREMCAIVKGYIAEALRVGGATDVQAEEIRCAARGDDHCAWRCTWQGRLGS